MTKRILLDTDIGSDIDDAVCLAYLLAEPQCELMGITTVSGEPDKRAMLADALCCVAGRDVPIYPGAASPLFVEQRQPLAQQAAALARWDHRTEFPQGEAVEFMRATIRRHPGEITLLSIGPLTNVALLFAIDPQIPSLLKRLVMMCGVFHHQLPGLAGCEAEWNALLDPHAAAIVYRTGVAVHRSVGLDVTCKVTMEASEVRRQFTNRLLEPVLDFSRYWFDKRTTLTFHDPLAAAALFDDRICGFERGTVTVELESEKLRGKTIWSPGSGSGPHEVATDVNPQRFFDTFFGAFDNCAGLSGLSEREPREAHPEPAVPVSVGIDL